MPDEAPPRPARAPDGGGHCAGGGGECSPLQARAAFLSNWDWQSIVGINERACARGRAQHGINPEAGPTCAVRWEDIRREELTLAAVFDFLRACHRGAPFLFFNGNTFSYIGRELTLVLLGDLPPVRKREAASAVAHYIAGVLDRESMVGIVDGLCQSAAFQPGDRVQTLKGTLRGAVIRVFDDGRLAWRPDSGGLDLVSLPESLRAEE